MRRIINGIRSRWELGFAVILLSGRYMRRRGDLFGGEEVMDK